jgi:ATP-dependent DNA helicase DinG
MKAEEYFGPEGLLSTAFDGYEYREGQEAMAQMVLDAIKDRHRVIIEAGTGTGKTLAYLIPAAVTGCRTVVSTATKALQGQLINSDVPKVHAAGLPLSAAVLKGRDNYVCRRKLRQCRKNPPIWAKKDERLWKKLQVWVRDDKGFRDRATFPYLGDDALEWADVTVSSQNCWRNTCPLKDGCYADQARGRAASAQVLIVNHHLFFADLMLKSEGAPGLLHNVDFVVLDEAHKMESAATGFFSIAVSHARVKRLIRSINSLVHTYPPGFRTKIQEMQKASETFFELLSKEVQDRVGSGSIEWSRICDDRLASLSQEGLERVEEVHVRLRDLNNSDIKQFDDPPLTAQKVSSILRTKTQRLMDEWEDVLCDATDNYVQYVQGRQYGARLVSSPICPGDVLEQEMLPIYPAMAFVSATLVVGESFDYFRSRAGLRDSSSAQEYWVESPFNYEKQAATYVPTAFPVPSSRDFIPNAADVIEELVKITGGRAFVLCTSYRNMHGLHKALSNRLPYQILVQGKMAKETIVKKFQEEPSVLFATASFWEGVDISGEALSLVVIDKIPFAPHTDPLVNARVELLKAEGRNAFMEYQVPTAALTLKQGFGRLIRRRTDRGIVAFLDTRLLTGHYAAQLWDALPLCSDCESIEQLQGWYHDPDKWIDKLLKM